MKLSDIDIYVLIDAFGMERSKWINLKKEENRRLTDVEKVTVCVLHAIEGALRIAASKQETMKYAKDAE